MSEQRMEYCGYEYRKIDEVWYCIDEEDGTREAVCHDIDMIMLLDKLLELTALREKYEKLCTDHGELIAATVTAYRLIASTSETNTRKAYDVLHAILAVKEIVCDTCAHKFTDEEACGLELDMPDPGEACPSWEITE